MLDKLVRDNIKSFKPYSVKEYKDVVKLDANENNNLTYSLNRKVAESLMDLKINQYPDSDSTKLRNILGTKLGLSADNLLVGRGSDELIGIVVNAFVDFDDSILTFSPTFGMYGLTAGIVGGKTVEVPLGGDFIFDYDAFIKEVEKQESKIIFLTNPNNPTGGIIPRKDIVRILDKAKSVVVVDEAYYEFCGETVLDLIGKYPNLIVLRTLSKAYGLAGARVGYAAGSKEILDILYKVKPPYNVSSLSQLAAKISLEEEELVVKAVEEIIEERDKMYQQLEAISNIKVYKSFANFLLCKVDNAKDLYNDLLDKGILVRDYGKGGTLKNCLRIAIGTKEENQRVMEVIKATLEV